ncbi:MAG TPA: PsbP-related protein [Actinomycetota bacterium]|nr:PsbP-related protein [Actinomycetota bacterium]
MRTRIRIPLVLALASALALVGCSGNGGGGSTATSSPTGVPGGTSTPSASGKTFSGNGISFQYPESWQEFTLSGTTASSGNQLWNETVGIDAINFVSVSGYTINIPITSGNIDDQKAGIGQQISDLFAQAGGGIDSGPTDETMAGLPALGFTGTANNPDGQPVSSRLVLAFDGTTEYFVNCQYDDSGQSELLAGCDQIVGSFAVG